MDIIPLAAGVGLFKALLYWILFHAVSEWFAPVIENRSRRALHAGLFRAGLGVVSTPLFLAVLPPFSEKNIAEHWLMILHQAVRAGFWLAAVLIFYGRKSFPTAGRHRAFAAACVLLGVFLNVLLDFATFGGTPLDLVNRKWC